MAENKKPSIFNKFVSNFGFLRKLSSHERAEEKFKNDLIATRIENQKDLITPPQPSKDQTTSYGDFFHHKGAVKIVSTVSSMANYLRIDSEDGDHKQAIYRYRSIALMPEVDDALDEYIHSIIVHNENDEIVRVDFKDSSLFSDQLRTKIEKEFNYILKVLDFDVNAEHITRSFLVDGCFPVEKVFDENYIARGIIDVNFLDPSYMTKVITFSADPYTNLRREDEIFYVFAFPQFINNASFTAIDTPHSSIRINPNCKLQIPEFLVSVTDTGKYHPTRLYPVSILHRALKVANQLKLLEDSILIYRLTRAPERRIFYIDVGNLPPTKAEEHIEDVMRQYRVEKSYNTETGGLNADADIMAMIEDFWLPRRNGTAATEVSTLSGAQNLGEIHDLDYFYKKLWRALGVPYNRRMARESSEGGQHPHTTEIAADEMAFYKNVRYLRKRIEVGLFKDLLKTQLVTRGIINAEFADDIMSNIKFRWNEDNNFAELIKFEIMEKRFDMVSNSGFEIQEFLSKPWVAKNLFNFSDAEIEELRDQRLHPEKYGFAPEDQKEEKEEGEDEFGGSFDNDFGLSSHDYSSPGGDFGNDFGSEFESGGEGGESEAPTESESPSPESNEEAMVDMMP